MDHESIFRVRLKTGETKNTCPETNPICSLKVLLKTAGVTISRFPVDTIWQGDEKEVTSPDEGKNYTNVTPVKTGVQRLSI